MPKNLVIVESPAKAKTIEGYLGKDFVVKSSFGHVRDLPKGDKAVDIANNFTPTYEVTSDKREVVSQLRKLVKDSEVVWLATDDDREGEAISWHLHEALNLQKKDVRRIIFREITKPAITRAIASPRGIDINLVNAQQARRVLDRLVGFELSPVLWRKIQRGLSAGRVQSVAVRLVVEREREINAFQAKSSFRVTAHFLLDGNKVLNAELPKRFGTEAEARQFLEACVGATFTIDNLEKKPGKKSPAPPFTTSTLQQEASRKLYFSVAQTMALAQKLYEAGKITYMRTDSLNLSDEAIGAAEQQIRTAYGPEFAHKRRFKTKSESAQEAHEAIRPTDFAAQQASGDRNEQRLYELIWKRAIASQMADARVEKTIATIGIASPTGNELPNLTATGEVVTFEGFLKVYLESTDDEEEDEQKGMLPPLTVGQRLRLGELKATERFSRPAPRYTEASLVKKLEELGIGRPSTYAPTISTIQKRGYVVKDSREGKPRSYRELLLRDDKLQANDLTENTGAEKSKLFPTDTAMVVNDFLVQYFPTVTDYSFTANIEKDFDEIAHGKRAWPEMIKQFYQDFHPKVESTADLDRTDVGSSRELGTDPTSGKPVVARLGRYGPMVQIGSADDEEKPRFASLLNDQRLETITLEEALELFKLPRTVGTYEDKEVIAAIGRFGPYVRHDGKFVSIPKGEDALTITTERAIELIEAKRLADANKYIKTFPENPDVQVLNGRYGPYIKVGKKNVKIPKDVEPADLSLDECLALAEKAPEKKGRGGARKSTAKKASAKKAPTAKKATARKTKKQP